MRGRTSVVLVVVLMTGCDRFWGLGDPHQDARPPDVLDAYTGVSYVQSTCEMYPSGGGPYTVILDQTTAGNLLIASVAHGGPAGSQFLLQDDQGHQLAEVLDEGFGLGAQLLDLADIPGGPIVITATMDPQHPNAGVPVRMCVIEYAGADRTSPLVLPGNKNKRGPGMSMAEVEGINVGAVTAPDLGLIAVVVFDSQQLPIVPADGFMSRNSDAANVLLEDTQTSITMDVATIYAQNIMGGDPWAAFAVAIQPPP